MRKEIFTKLQIDPTAKILTSACRSKFDRMFLGAVGLCEWNELVPAAIETALDRPSSLNDEVYLASTMVLVLEGRRLDEVAIKAAMATIKDRVQEVYDARLAALRTACQGITDLCVRMEQCRADRFTMP